MKPSISTKTLQAWLAVVVVLVLVGAAPSEAAQRGSGRQPAKYFVPFDDPGPGGGGSSERSGMTWQKVEHNSSYSVDHVDCYGCNPYTGDTSCSTALPVLCINMDGSPNPGVPTNFFIGWQGGNIALTPPIVGTSLVSLANANAICQLYHGTGWQMAEFHHPGGGWSWWSYGNVSSATRFWTYINDQPANCWN